VLSARALVFQTGAAFAAVILAFIGLGLAIPALVRPHVTQAGRIHRDLGDALRLLAEMRGAVVELRSSASLARYAEGPSRESELAEARADVGRRAAELMRLAHGFNGVSAASDPTSSWSSLERTEIPAVVRLASSTVHAAERGASTRELVRALIVRSMEIDRALEQLADANIRAVTRNAESIHGALRWLVFGCVAIALAGGSAAVFLLRRNLRLTEAYGKEKERRISDLDAFAARVAHDLRTPLQTIQLSILGLRNGVAGDPRLAPAAARAQRATERLDAMITDVLEFSRTSAPVETGRFADVGTVLAEIREETQTIAAQRGVDVRLRASDGLTVAMSPAALHSVLGNLVQNAIKYAREDQDRSVDVVAAHAGGFIEIGVSDNGIGISRRNLPLVFDPFFRGTDRRDSYGLGLATVKRIIDSHRGTISVDSTEGVGSTFTVRLVAARGAAQGASVAG
jgi:signal transduction histidine kinase